MSCAFITLGNAIKLSHFDQVKIYVRLMCDALKYIENVFIYVNHILSTIKGTWQFNGALVRTPYDASMSLNKNKWGSVSQFEYARIIESILCFL